MRNFIEFHYDGPIKRDHQITARTLSVTVSHLQSAIDRAVIDLRCGRVHKHVKGVRFINPRNGVRFT